MSNEWTKTLCDKMEHYEETAPQGLFDDVMDRLEVLEQSAAPVSVEEKVMPNRTGRKATVVTLMMGAAAVGLVLLTNTSVNNVAPVIKPNAPLASIQEQETPTKQYINTEKHGQASQMKRIEEGAMVAEVAEQADMAVLPGQQEEPSEKMEEELPVPEKPKRAISARPREERLLASANDRRTVRRGLRFGLSLGGVPNVSSLTNLGHAELDYSATYGVPTLVAVDYVPVGQNEISKKAHHHQPLTAGVTVAVPLTTRLSIETGLMYSYHSSTIAYSMGSVSYDRSQQLHFVGIPVDFNYSLWQNRKLNVYAAAGGRAEKLVSGRQEDGEDRKGEMSYKKVKMDRLQWSLSGRVGMEYKLSSKLGLYVEPGVGYHFDNGSDIQTIYNDCPMTFELKAGIRFNTR
uniref:Outer membrane beta-barrel protein n=1 Tax=Prevotella sp. GTC17262 TaxID=3236797 RepID=A0AB33JQ32_9BACT